LTEDRSHDHAIELPVEKSIFITAPPGYGKTRVLSERVNHLILNGHIKPPQKILVLTFSNAAANEMRDRIRRSISNADKYVDIMNFHTISYLIMRNYCHYIGMSRNFMIIDESIEYDFKKEFFKKKGCIVEKNDEYNWINNGYNRWFSQKFLGHAEPEKSSDYYDEELFDELRNEIDTELINESKLNFDYLLFRCLDIFKRFPTIKDIFFLKYRYILADEFQDTNHVQYLLFKEISTDSKNKKRPVFVVGDKKQAIMRFQGANPKNIERLIEDFDCEEHELKKNHRTASHRIKEITERLRNPDLETSSIFDMFMVIKTHKKPSTIDRINFYLVKKIVSLMGDEIRLHDICVLVPQESLLNPLKEKLEEQMIDFISISDYSYKSIRKNYFTLFERIETLINENYDGNSVNKVIQTIINDYYSENENDPILNTIINYSNKFDRMEYDSLETWQRLQEFYNHLQMDIDWTKLIRTKTKNHVFLSTIHSAKGLEFKYIFIMGIDKYKVPHHSTCTPENKCDHGQNISKVNISSAKDLFYVAVSRSIEDVFFFFSKQYINSKQEISNKNRISCVFRDIQDMLRFVDVDDNRIYDVENNKIKRLFCD
jgi:superfamily I DNA/RNA helicase